MDVDSVPLDDSHVVGHLVPLGVDRGAKCLFTCPERCEHGVRGVSRVWTQHPVPSQTDHVATDGRNDRIQRVLVVVRVHDGGKQPVAKLPDHILHRPSLRRPRGHDAMLRRRNARADGSTGVELELCIVRRGQGVRAVKVEQVRHASQNALLETGSSPEAKVMKTRRQKRTVPASLDRGIKCRRNDILGAPGECGDRGRVPRLDQQRLKERA
mmetsp:Transcript_4596/g.13034  ORF Transcript_4596/g.13034 Transcript_4596/m.13034 type:complete len:212 (-) Transcript_4596:285-920(-)